MTHKAFCELTPYLFDFGSYPSLPFASPLSHWCGVTKLQIALTTTHNWFNLLSTPLVGINTYSHLLLKVEKLRHKEIQPVSRGHTSGK